MQARNSQGAIVGAIVCKLDSVVEVVYGYEVMTRFGYIAMLAVHESTRRQHIGSRLVEAAIQEMISCKCEEVSDWLGVRGVLFLFLFL